MKIQTGAPEGSPSSLLLCSPIALLSKNPKGVTGGWYGHGTGPSSSPQPSPSVPLGAFSKPHFPAAPKSPHAPSQRQVASIPPASAPLVTSSLPKLAVGTGIPNVGIHHRQHRVSSSFSPPNSWQNLPKFPLPAASSSPSAVCCSICLSYSPPCSQYG